MIARLEEAAQQGALYAFAMPRGSGKTTVCRMAALWAISYAVCRYVVIIGANDTKATDSLCSLKTFIRFLPLYVADFPEISHAARALGGIAQRASGQLCCGEPTLMEWGQNQIILPTVPPPPNWPADWPRRADGAAPTSGAIVSATGLTADGIRGSLITLNTGEPVRPDLVLVDDPSSRESAGSPTQNTKRIELLSGDVLGMAGPNRTISAVMPCTVIYRGDVADVLLDRSKHPLWRGERTKLLRSMPSDLVAWERYFEVYADCAQLEPPDFTAANNYYLEHRAELDAGAEASWPERKLPGEISAVQHAMHLYFRDRRAFMAEYQNEPEAADLTEGRQLAEEDLAVKLNRLARGVVPRGCSRLTAFIDVQGEVLFWAVCGWTDHFGGALVDYGTYPGQRRAVFDAGDPDTPLSMKFPLAEQRARIYAGLGELVPALLGRHFRQDGADGALSVSLCLIDAGFEADAVHDFLSRSPLKAVLRASKGKGIGPRNRPMNEYRKEPGDLVGWNWRQDAKTQAKGRFVSFSTNPWKTFVAEALLAPGGSRAAFHLPGERLADHPLLTLHLLSEYRVATAGPWGRCEEWGCRPGQRENHWWDAVVGCAVAASVLGLKFSATGEAVGPDQPRKRVKYSDLHAKKAAERAAAGGT